MYVLGTACFITVRAIIPHAAAGKRFEMVVDACIFLEKQNLPFFFSLYSGFLRHYTQTVTRKKVAGIEVASVRGLVF